MAIASDLHTVGAGMLLGIWYANAGAPNDSCLVTIDSTVTQHVEVWVAMALPGE